MPLTLFLYIIVTRIRSLRVLYIIVTRIRSLRVLYNYETVRVICNKLLTTTRRQRNSN